MRGHAQEKQSTRRLVGIAAIGAAVLLFTASFTRYESTKTSAQPPAASEDIERAPLEPALRSLNGVTQHG